MCGMTPPPAIVALMRVSSSSSPLIASCKCLGVILFTFKSLDALPASSRTSAVKYSRIAALYTADVAPTLLLDATLLLRNLWILPTGNYRVITVRWVMFNLPEVQLLLILIGELSLICLLHTCLLYRLCRLCLPFVLFNALKIIET